VLQPEPSDAVVFVALVGFSTLFLLVVSDFLLTWTMRPPVGAWVTLWAKRYPAYAIALALVAGGLVGHFFFATNP
jgi:hypothetical protein